MTDPEPVRRGDVSRSDSQDRTENGTCCFGIGRKIGHAGFQSRPRVPSLSADVAALRGRDGGLDRLLC